MKNDHERVRWVIIPILPYCLSSYIATIKFMKNIYLNIISHIICESLYYICCAMD